jgi:hypothetical protein
MRTLFTFSLILAAGCSPAGDPEIGPGADEVSPGGGGSTAEGSGTGAAQGAGTQAMGGSNAAGGASSGGAGNFAGASGSGGDKGSTSDASAIDARGAGDSSPPDVVVVKVGACDSLPADGVWNNIDPPGGNEVSGVAIDPRFPGTVYAGTENGAPGGHGFWRSTDCGATWKMIATGANSKLVTSGYNWQIVVDPVTSDVLAVSGYGALGLYKSTNGGVDWSDITPKGSGLPTFVHQFSMDPADHNHILLDWHEECSGAACGPAGGGCFCQCVTRDGGKTWNTIRGPFDKGWSEAAHPMLDGNTFLYGDAFDGLFYSVDGGATWKSPSGGGPCFSDLLKASDGTDYIGCMDSIRKSADRGITWSRLPSSSRAMAVAITGQYMYAGYMWDADPIRRAPLSNLSAWSEVPMPQHQAGPAPGQMAYDASHRVLYVTNFGHPALWRMVTP